uniref:Putative secreted protein n=1 Tax=Ixodes ricinus TaxID=34613 RepID=A0A6B0TZT3_IXORI
MQRIVQAFWVATLATNCFVDAQQYSRCSTSAAHRYCFSRYHGMKEVASLPSKQLRYTTSTGLQLQLAHGHHSASCTACSSKCRSRGP